MAFDFEKWDQRVRRDLQWRMSNVDKIWERNEKYVRNDTTDRYGNKVMFKGNLVREFEKVIYHRVVNKDPVIKVRSADTTFTDNANDLEIVANDISRIVRLKDALRQATMYSTYSMGWLEVGHPYAAFGLNPAQYAGINRNITDPSTLESQWEEVDPQLAKAQGIDLERVDDLSPLDFDPDSFLTGVDKEPAPVFNDHGIGFPYLTYVNGKHVITPAEIENYLDADYVARLRILTGDELKTLSGENFDKVKGVSRQYWSLFPGIDFDYLGDECFLICECWVKRDRLDSNYNNWYSAWILGDPDSTVRDMPNPWGGMTPYTPVKLTKMGKFLERTVVDDIVPVSDMYSIALQSIDQDMLDSLNPKVIVDQTANAKDDDIKKLLNPSYRGAIKVNRAEGITIERGPGIDLNKIQYIRFLREIAQQSTATSEIDKGQAVKKITARQTSALVEATDQIIGGMRELVAESAQEAITKLMFILGLFHGKKQQYKYGHKVVTFDQGTHDFTTSLIYQIDVRDMGPEPGTEEKMLYTQFIRTVSMNPALSEQYDWNKVATEVARIFGWAPDTVVEPQPPMPTEEDLAALGAPAAQPGLQSQVNPNPGRGPTDQSQSAEPPNLANALSGMVRGA
tara:strand:+ start:1819 stop:3693 length:1875 start_codon:yes stop_codon:yes gene_type:complete